MARSCALRKNRRELVVALAGSTSISPQQIAEIAVMQHAIAAIEAVIGDLDTEVTYVPTARPALRLVHSVPARQVLQGASLGGGPSVAQELMDTYEAFKRGQR